MFVNGLYHLIRDCLVTLELEFLQSGKFVDAGERCGRGPDNHLEPRSRSAGEDDLGDGRAVKNKKVEPLEVILF
jgi:hypothetical protein